jgi:hypothetical protein
LRSRNRRTRWKIAQYIAFFIAYLNRANLNWLNMHKCGIKMMSHKFQIGEIVYLAPAIGRNVPGGACEVTKQLPHNGQEFEYHIKSANEEHERVARESDLRKP